MFVTKPFRRQGVGTQLLIFLKQWALQTKLEKITLSVFSTNVPAIQFFEKHGFAREGVLSRQIKNGDDYADFILMRLFLK
jgi:RimJ/RimL family protein N-acetyltransferase